MNAGEYAQWYYLIYLLPGGAALLFLLLSVIGGGHHHRGGRGQHHVGGHRQAGSSAAGRAAQQVGAFLGAGRVPPALVWGSLLLGWGLFGFWGTRLLQPVLPTLFAVPALALAAAGGLATARSVAWSVMRWLPSETTFAVGTVDLCGQTGTVAYPVDLVRGRVHVYDAHGTLHDVSARVAPGRTTIARGCRVLVADYDAAHDFVVVEELV